MTNVFKNEWTCPSHQTIHQTERLIGVKLALTSSPSCSVLSRLESSKWFGESFQIPIDREGLQTNHVHLFDPEGHVKRQRGNDSESQYKRVSRTENVLPLNTSHYSEMKSLGRFEVLKRES